MTKLKIASIKPSTIIIKANKIIRFIKVGFFLHVMALLGIMLFVIGIQKSLYFFMLDQTNQMYWWLLAAVVGFVVLIFAELDANGRYQNYKQIKDVLYKMGYDPRLIKPLTNSKCQRDAVLVAAADLNHTEKVKDYFYRAGYRWYHILPDAFLKDPWILLKKQFWTRILFIKTYHLKNFYW